VDERWSLSPSLAAIGPWSTTKVSSPCEPGSNGYRHQAMRVGTRRAAIGSCYRCSASYRCDMPEKRTIRRARADLRRGKSPTTAAGEFVREEIEHVREGKHGARSTKQAIAIGLSKARRAGVPLKPPKEGTSERTRQSAKRAYEIGQGMRKPRRSSRKRGRATLTALKREPRRSASRTALSRQAKRASRRRRKTAKAGRRRA
jgi:hypothetical protein